MKLSGCCLNFEIPEKKIMKMYKDAGFDAVNLDYLNKEDYIGGLEDFYPLGDDYLERAYNQRKNLDEAGLVCNQTHAPFGFRETEEPSESNPHFSELVRAIEVTSIVGAPHTVIHPIKPASIEDARDCNIAMFKALLPYCEKFGVKIALETCHLKYRINGKVVSYIDSAETYCDLITELGSDKIVACIDLGHTAGGVDHLPEEFVSRMKKGILQGLHVQDCDYIHDNHTTPFFQHLNWEKIMKALSDIDYSGDLTFEDVNEKRYFPSALMESTIKYRAKVGRYLIDMFEKYQKEKNG